jgi:hypothetical protein
VRSGLTFGVDAHTCDGSAGQQWMPVGPPGEQNASFEKRHLLNRDADECLDADVDSAGLRIIRCTGTATQEWDLVAR